MVAGQADVVLVLEKDGRPCGFITCHLLDKHTGQCQLSGLDPELRGQGLGSRTTTRDLLVFGQHGPIDNHTRFGNEPARHKILDILGDLSLIGCDLVGHVVAYRSGHPHNVELVRLLSLQMPTVVPRQHCRSLAA